MEHESDMDLALRAAWMSYIGGYTQSEIAERLGISRIKTHRLIAMAQDSGLIKVSIEGQPARLIELEDRLKEAFDLRNCVVVPSFDENEHPQGNFPALGAAAAHLLRSRLEQPGLNVLGVGWGRSLAEMGKRLPRLARPDLRVVSVLGSLTRKMAINPLDVAHSIADATGGEAYFLPVPLIADNMHDRDVLLGQRSVREIYALAQKADLSLIGVGVLEGPSTPMLERGLITSEEFAELAAAGAVADLVGQFINADGALVDCEVNRRTLSVDVADLAGQEVIAIAGGASKATAILASLRSGLISGLITDEAAASRVVGHLES